MDENESSRSGNTVLSGLLEFLECKPGVKDVKLVRSKPASLTQIVAWEKTNYCGLSDDLKNFYLTNDGVTLTWNFAYNEAIHRLGRLNINGLTQLQLLGGQSQPILFSQDGSFTSAKQPSLLELDPPSKPGSPWKPSLGGCCKVFTLDYCPSCGHTCLVYNMEEGSDTSESGMIWLLDLSLSWHPLCSSFSDYLRLAVVHLGLKQWPYTLTVNGLSPQFERWFHMFTPKRLELDLNTVYQSGPNEPTSHIHPGTHTATPTLNTLDVSRIVVSKSSRDKKSKSDGTSKPQANSGKKPLPNK